MLEINKIYNEDCIEGMRRIEDGSVDMILCDLPYGVLNKSNSKAKWDCIIPFDKLWEQYVRIIKSNGAILLFGQGMFTAKLMFSNPNLWRYNLIWKKGNRSTAFLNANRQPLRCHEDICVFYKKQPTYNPQKWVGRPNHTHAVHSSVKNNRCYGDYNQKPTIITELKFPISVIDIEKEHKKQYHPTMKPVALLEYLINTYTNEGELVLDNCIGSGSTAVACVRTKRNYIGFELDKEYYDIACERIKEEQNQLKLF